MLVARNKIILFIFLFIIFLFFIVMVKYKLHQVNDDFETITIKNAVCQLEENRCSVENDKFKLDLNMDKNIYYLSAFNVTANTEVKGKHQIQKIQLDFNMKGMDMGINRVVLKPGKQGNNTQQWHAEGLLPICVSGRADWIAELEIEIDRTRYHLQFPVIVQKINQ